MSRLPESDKKMARKTERRQKRQKADKSIAGLKPGPQAAKPNHSGVGRLRPPQRILPFRLRWRGQPVPAPCGGCLPVQFAGAVDPVQPHSWCLRLGLGWRGRPCPAQVAGVCRPGSVAQSALSSPMRCVRQSAAVRLTSPATSGVCCWSAAAMASPCAVLASHRRLSAHLAPHPSVVARLRPSPVPPPNHYYENIFSHVNNSRYTT
jgi:hypothetical protein